MIRAVFLDLYNTIVYFVPPRDERQSLACREFGLEVAPSALWRAYVAAEDYWTEHNGRYPLVRRTPEELESFYAEYERVLLTAAGLDVSLEQALQIYRRYSQMERRLALFDDVLPTMAEIKRRGLVLGLISNTDRDVAPLCADLGVADGFDFMLSSCVVGFEKPDPRIFRKALELAGVDPQEAIHIGDQYKSDVAGALASGIKPLLLDRYNMLGHLDGCDHISGLAEILNHLD
ncbi:MAG: HAD family hydrolase [Chloroflexota bacterium]